MSETDEKVIALLCADFHLSHKPPIWRSAEPDWYEAMQRPLDELRNLQIEHDCPILCAGDIFDKWNSPAELINWALEHLPNEMYCIPGQHDLPDHNYHEIERSAYWTLVKAGKIRNVTEEWRVVPNLAYRGFPFGSKLKPCTIKSEKIKIVIIHEYRWIPGYAYQGVPIKQQLPGNLPELGYNVIIYGDNHKGFLVTGRGKRNKIEIFNCGTLMRRASDEKEYKPQVGLLYTDGKIGRHYLQTANDKYLDTVDDSLPMEEMDISEFIEELKKLGETGLDFLLAVERFFKKHKVSKTVQDIIRKGMEQ